MAKPDLLLAGALPRGTRRRCRGLHAPSPLAGNGPRCLLAEHGPKLRAIATRGDLGADAALIAACPKLEIVSVFGVGYDAVDLAACRARGIRVTNTPDVLTDDCADLALAMFLPRRGRSPRPTPSCAGATG